MQTDQRTVHTDTTRLMFVFATLLKRLKTVSISKKEYVSSFYLVI